ncbi:MAG: class I SAM-dependent methyltransferase [Candidatus Melainabacteria bacterium]|nr:class I SAM-dependent methyltransferase [Candidatus Melainabacteria bacterium]
MPKKEICKMEYGKDEQGKDVLLKDGKFQVMMEWEKPYMQACIDALKPFGDVLEIGFGLGYSATAIQSYHPKSHTIVEYHPEVAKHARQWAKKYPNVTIVEDTWQNALPHLAIFDCIFFDDYPLHSEQQMQAMEKESHQSQLLLKQGQKLINEVEKTLPFLSEIHYGDEELHSLMNEIDPSQLPQFVRFLSELCSRGQITQKQFNHIAQELKISQHELDGLCKKSPPVESSGLNERLFSFLLPCLKSHMRKGSRFSCFLSSPDSKYTDDKFVNEVIANPYLDYEEKEITLAVPSNCDY